MTVSIQNSEKLHAYFKIQYSILNIFKIQYFLRLPVKRRRNTRFCFRTSLPDSSTDDKEFHLTHHDFWEKFRWQFSQSHLEYVSTGTALCSKMYFALLLYHHWNQILEFLCYLLTFLHKIKFLIDLHFTQIYRNSSRNIRNKMLKMSIYLSSIICIWIEKMIASSVIK